MALLHGIDRRLERLAGWTAGRRRHRSSRHTPDEWPLVYRPQVYRPQAPDTGARQVSQATRPASQPSQSIGPRPRRLAAALGVLLVVLAAWYLTRNTDVEGPSAPRISSGTDLEPMEQAATPSSGSLAQDTELLAVAPAPTGESRAADDWALPRPPLAPALLPIVLEEVRPEYPEAAKAAGVEGTVVVTYVLDPAGRPRDLQVVKSIPMLDRAVTDALRQWEYTPPVPAAAAQRYRYHADFALSSSSP